MSKEDCKIITIFDLQARKLVNEIVDAIVKASKQPKKLYANDNRPQKLIG